MQTELATGRQEIVIHLPPGETKEWIERTKRFYGDQIREYPHRFLTDDRRSEWHLLGFEVRKRDWDPLDMDLKDLVIKVFVTLFDPFEAKVGEYVYLTSLSTGQEVPNMEFVQEERGWRRMR